ncbi:MAG: efflux RND transporter permease subunit [Candidatus Omnitrophota bacterium]|jgi:HAE1 family hydrophobic/amphiphilic exporter-1|nr:MAG: efflux RND transporter permease subunit [Candidatus Omnitrophota bacterium]
MKLAEFGVKRPVANLMIFTAIIVLAFYSLTRLGVDSFPEIEPPSISVISSYPGANPEDVEIKVTEVLENQLATTPGIEKITSHSSEGSSVVTLKFSWGTDLDAASNDIRDRIEIAKRSLPDIPDEMDNPFIFKFNTSNIPILFMGITATQSYTELYDLLDDRIADPLRQLPGVGTVQFQGGGLERQINVWIDRERLQGYGFSILDIKNAIKAENITQPVGNIKVGLTDYSIRLPGEFTDPGQINSVVLGKRNGKIIYLRDVARVEDGFKEVTTIARVDEGRAIIMMVQKQSGTNTVEVADRVKKKLEELRYTLPPDVKMRLMFDNSEDIKTSLSSLKATTWFAILLVIVVVWFFLRQFAASMIVALTIPFSLLISFIYLFLSGKTINVISLSSLAIASGMVVDNAIVVVDNVWRRIEHGQRTSEASIFGTSEIFLAIAASTLTTIVVFMPLLFLTGVVGKLFGELAAIIIVTLSASLFTAVTFSPMLCSKWLKPDHKSLKAGLFNRMYAVSEQWFKSMENTYSNMLAWCLKYKKMVISISLGILIFVGLLTRFVGNEFIPEEDTGDLRISAHLPIGTRVEETDGLARKIEQIFKDEIPEAKYFYVRSGQLSGIGRAFGNVSGTHIVSAGIKLVPKTERKLSVKETAEVVRNRITAIPGVMKVDITTGNPMGRLITGGGKSIQVEIIGHSFEETDALALKIKGLIEGIPGAVEVSISREANRPELKIDVDRQKSSALGLDMSTIADTVNTFIQGSVASKYRESGDTYDIYVRADDFSRSDIEDIKNIPVVPADSAFSLSSGSNPRLSQDLRKTQITLSNIAEIRQENIPQEIERKNRERIVKVECNAYRRSTGKIVEDINKELKNMIIPAGIQVIIGGEAEEQAKAFKDLFLLLILGILLVYMVMAAQFESLLDPFIIMFSIPFTFIGVILAFIITGTNLSVISFLGIVMLMGIVVNNAIVLISYINILRARGYSMHEAVTTGGRDRLRPVLMTTITTLVGLLPLALFQGEGSESWQPLGITMIGGLTVSTLITLLFVPTLYAIFESRVKKNKRKTNA